MPKVAGHVDGFEGHYLLGWAIAEPDAESCRVEVTDENGCVVGRGRATRARPDLKSLERGRTNFAFRIPVQLEGRRLLRVSTHGVDLDGSPITVGTGQWDGVFAVSNGDASGWVSERASTSTSGSAPQIVIRDPDGIVVAKTQSTLDRLATDPHFLPARFKAPLAQACFGRGEILLTASIEGSEFARTRGNLRLDGFLDLISSTRCAGWLLSPDAVDRDLEIDIIVNGQAAATVRCSNPREDLRGPYPEAWRKGFDIAIPAGFAATAGLMEISLRLTGSDVDLFNGPFVVGAQMAVLAAARNAARLSHASDYRLSLCERSVLQTALAEFIQKHRTNSDPVIFKSAGRGQLLGDRRLNVIIPVYRDVEVTRECIESVLRHGKAFSHGLVIVNDCSPEPQMSAMLKEFDKEPSVIVISNEANQGFVKSVNRALDCCPHGDVVLLNSDTRVFAGWLEELWAVAHASSDIGTVTALSNNATIFTYPHPRLTASALQDTSWEEMAAAALRQNSGLVLDVPTGHGFCLLIKRAVLGHIAQLDEKYGRGYGEENDLCCRAADLGFRNVAAAGVLVEHRENVSFGAEKAILWERNRPQLEAAFPEYTPQVMAYEERDDLRRARWALDEFRLIKANGNGHRFVLLIHNWLGGGSAIAVKDLHDTIDPALSRLTLSARSDGYIALAADDPAMLAVFAPGEEKRLFRLLSVADIHLVIIHQLLGFGSNFFESLADWLRTQPSAYYLHDFYPFCPRVNLIDATGQFCDVPDVEVCERCVQAGGTHDAARANGLSVTGHRQAFMRVFAKINRVIAPSRNTATYFQQVFPDIAVTVIPHPQSLWKFPTSPRTGSHNDIVLLGAVGPHKGSGTLLEIAKRARLTHPDLRFHVVGYTNIDTELLALGNVAISGEYLPAELPGLVDKTGACIALFLHGWPETFSYALTEAVALGLVPLVPDIGAPAERVRAAGFGLVYPFPFAAAQILGVIDDVSHGKTTPCTDDTNPTAFCAGTAHTEATRALLSGLRPKLLPTPRNRRRLKYSRTAETGNLTPTLHAYQEIAQNADEDRQNDN